MQFENIHSPNYSAENSVLSVFYYAENYQHNIEDDFPAELYSLKKFDSIKSLQEASQNLSIDELNTNILIEVNQETQHEVFQLVDSLKSNWLTRNIIVIFLLTEKDPAIVKKALKQGVSDCYVPPIFFNDVKQRLRFLSFYKQLRSEITDLSQIPTTIYKTPWGKRFLDIFLSSIALLIISPLLLLVAILIKLDSKGPVFYTSKRVGTGYKIFDFYKFRSMRQGADKEVEKLSKNNQYKGESAFFKVQNDPRVTKLGSFLRNTSIDELPQLVNVLKGDMSLVGNRPLPLYEAEKLTTNEWSMRFLGPAGLTGLWQISKRGKKEISERERKKLDNFYASNYSLWLDLKIILKTIPALLQKEKV
ncbi:sugar transferase [Pseudopedobacter beijingensis]|uniref:Sugar transferase n=1 Tax=Pseudopedobacter beijingensis TaxID=1207056 RepID=A0ABW4IEA2_9SPHI